MEAFEFSFALIGKGWDQKLDQNSEEHANPPNKKIVLKVGFIQTSFHLDQRIDFCFRSAV